MNVVNAFVMEMACKEKDYTGQASCSEGINLEGT